MREYLVYYSVVFTAIGFLLFMLSILIGIKVSRIISLFLGCVGLLILLAGILFWLVNIYKRYKQNKV